MSGKIEVKEREGESRDPTNKSYNEWYLEVADENTGKKVTCSPEFKELAKVLTEIIEHEKRNDKETIRKQMALIHATELLKGIFYALDENDKKHLVENISGFFGYKIVKIKKNQKRFK